MQTKNYFNPYKYKTSPNKTKGVINLNSFLNRLGQAIREFANSAKIRRTVRGIEIEQNEDIIEIRFISNRLWRVSNFNTFTGKYKDYYSFFESQYPLFRLFIDYVRYYVG